MFRHIVAVVASVVVLLAGAARAQDEYQQKPLPAGPEAYTDAKLERDRIAFWTGLLLAECAARPGYKEEWRPQFEAMLGAFAQWWNEQQVDQDVERRLRDAHDRLRQLGCDDPILGWAVAYADLAEGRNDAAAAWLRDGAPVLRQRLQGKAVRFLCEHTCQEFAYGTGQEAAAATALADCDARLGEAIASGEFGPDAQRFLHWAILRTLQPKPQSLPRLEALEKAAGKPNYALLVFRAKIENALAWGARGQGTSASIGDRERDRFLDHVKAALTAATQAYELCPQHPEAPDAMIENLGVLGGGTELRVWFDRAVAAQFDYWSAYASYAHYLQPRWGGSARDMQAFGQECLATGRFDTAVPHMYVKAIQYLTLDARDALSVWKRTSVQERLEQLEKGYTAAATTDQQRVVAATHRIVRLAVGGQAEAAAAEYERQRQTIDDAILGLYALPKDWLPKVVRPHMRSYMPAAIPARDLFAGHATATYPGVDKAVPFSVQARAASNVQVEARAAQWFGRVYVAAYDKHGVHDAKWDADARELLGRFGELVSLTTTDSTRELAQKLLDADCADPLVLYAATRARAGDSASRRLRRMTTAVAGIDKSYGPAFQWFARQHLWFVARDAGRNDIAADVLPEMRERIAAAVADPIFAEDGRGQFMRCIAGSKQWVHTGTSWVTDDVVAAMAKVEGGDPWIVHVASGLHLARLARHVTATQGDRLQRARTAKEQLEKAYALHPELPEAAVGMIVVAALLREDGAPTPREWLDRALAAEVDCAPALHAFVDTLRPGAGGSIQAMYRFAAECLESGRFDTDLPLWYAWTLQRIAAEADEPRAVWAATGVGKNLERLFAGYLAKGNLGHEPAYFHSGRCLTAWAGGRYGDAVLAWKAAGTKLDPVWLATVGLEDLELVEIDLKAAGKPRPK